MRVEEFLIANGAARPTKTALVTERVRLRYDELDDLASRLAAALAANGVGRGDRVLVFMDNCWEAAVSIFAVLKAGAVFSPINASTKADKLSYIFANSGAAAVLTQARLMPVVSSTLTGRDGVSARHQRTAAASDGATGTMRVSCVTWRGSSSASDETPSRRIVRSISLRRIAMVRSTPRRPPAMSPYR